MADNKNPPKDSAAGEGASWGGGGEQRLPDPEPVRAPVQRRSSGPGPGPGPGPVPVRVEPTPTGRIHHDDDELPDGPSVDELMRPPDEGVLPGAEDFQALGRVVGGFFSRVGVALRDSVWRPAQRAVSAIKAKVFEERVVDSDTFDRQRAEDWKKFNKGRTSSSYLQDDEKRR